MKKLLASFAIAAIFSLAANAQDSSSSASTAATKPSTTMAQTKGEMGEKYKNASPEEKAKMDKRREMMAKLTPEQKELVKKEFERHRQEMKKITGMDMGEQSGTQVQ
jgi:hypothetical protein